MPAQVGAQAAAARARVAAEDVPRLGRPARLLLRRRRRSGLLSGRVLARLPRLPLSLLCRLLLRRSGGLHSRSKWTVMMCSSAGHHA